MAGAETNYCIEKITIKYKNTSNITTENISLDTAIRCNAYVALSKYPDLILMDGGRGQVNIANEILRNLGFKILLQVHDELIGECPKENADKVAEILTTVMKESAKPVVSIPFKCDATIETRWYETDYSDALNNEY